MHQEEDSEDSRTVFCGNLHENVTEALLYELFMQAGPLERVTVPKKDGRQCSFGFITYSHGCSVPYAVELFCGTRLFDRDLRIKARDRAPQQNHSQQSQHQSNESLNRSGSRSNNNSFELPPPGNPFSGNASLRSGFNGGSHSNNMDMRPSNNQRKPELVKSQLANINQLLQMGSQMLTSANVSNDHNHHQSSSRFRDEHDDRASSNSEHSTTRPYRRNQSSYRRDNDPYDNNRRHNNDRGQHQNRDRNNRNAGSGSGRHRY